MRVLKFTWKILLTLLIVFFFLLLSKSAILFQMNYTRQHWSKSFHCVKIFHDLVSVVALTVFFCFLPIIFYSAARLQGASEVRKTGKEILSCPGVLLVQANAKSLWSFVQPAIFDLQLEWMVGGGGGEKRRLPEEAVKMPYAPWLVALHCISVNKKVTNKNEFI